MLVLSRREMERILIGDDIVVTVVRLQGDRVRIGIDAPKHIPILRDDTIQTSPPANVATGKRVSA